jgi:hypothetical protein
VRRRYAPQRARDQEQEQKFQARGDQGAYANDDHAPLWLDFCAAQYIIAVR